MDDEVFDFEDARQGLNKRMKRLRRRKAFREFYGALRIMLGPSWVAKQAEIKSALLDLLLQAAVAGFVEGMTITPRPELQDGWSANQLLDKSLEDIPGLDSFGEA